MLDDAEAEAIEITETSMLADLMNCILEQLRAMPKSWDAIAEIDQDDFITLLGFQC